MVRGVKLSNDAREILYRVYIYFTLEAEKFETDVRYFGKVRYRVAQATGISTKTIYHLIAAKGKPGTENFTKALESLKRSSETYNLPDEEDDTSAAKKSKINGCETNVSEVEISEPIYDLTVDKPEPPTQKKHSSEVNIQTKENPCFVTQRKLYVKTTTVYTTKGGPAISKMNDIEKILGIKQPNVEPESNVNSMQAYTDYISPNLPNTQKVFQKATDKTKCLPEVVFIKAKNSIQNIVHTSGSTSTTVPKKPERTIIKVHRIRQKNAETTTTPECQNIVVKPIVTPNFIKLESQYKSAKIDPVMSCHKNAETTTTPECQNIVVKPIVTPDFIKLEAQYKSAEIDPVIGADNVKVEIKTETNYDNFY
ncbi:unnamed protein product [Arctia plantaginis]|uniref:Uncharacterized protein n=1 Tax=Arctia plantaginis TaxID=874455 RepID=A0A8S1BNA0_ARCPL|nr:unnamed protein product [Arctia plantaginis]